MTGWNLPPGCNVSDLPGNTRADHDADALMDEIYNALDGFGLTDAQQDTLGERIAALAGKWYGAGYSQASADAALAEETNED